MTVARDKHTNNVVIGAGELFMDILDDDGNTQGERYLGDTTAASLSVTQDTSEVFSGDGPRPQVLVETITSSSHVMTMTLHDMSADNLSLLIGGDADTQSDAASAVVDEVLTVKPGFWYQLGVSDTNPAGVGAVSESGFAVTDEAGNTTYTKGTDYELDHENARIEIVAGGGIAAGKIKVDYTPVAASYDRVKSTDDFSIEAAIRYIEDPAAGKGRNYYIQRAKISVGGETALKSGRDAEQQISLTATTLKPLDGRPAITVNGAAI